MGTKVAVLSAVSAGGMVGGPAALGGVAGGMLAGGAVAVPVISSQRATTEQKSTALRVARNAESKMDPQLRKQLLASNKPYIAVRTRRSSSSNEKAKAQVMVYDIERDAFASPEVFDVKVEPKEGQFATFDTFFTQYVGDGSTGTAPPPKDDDNDSSEETGDDNE